MNTWPPEFTNCTRRRSYRGRNGGKASFTPSPASDPAPARSLRQAAADHASEAAAALASVEARSAGAGAPRSPPPARGQTSFPRQHEATSGSPWSPLHVLTEKGRLAPSLFFCGFRSRLRIDHHCARVSTGLEAVRVEFGRIGRGDR